MIDILVIKSNETLAVQSKSGSNVTSRVRKIAEAEATPDIHAGWRFVMHD